MSLEIFDEGYYLANNPDVANAVRARAFSSGLDHFERFGIRERSRASSVSPLYNEQLYLQANPDVANAVRSGVFSSGLQHYIQYGEAEGRSGTFGLYNESAYLQSNADVANAVRSGAFSSGFQHYIQYGAGEGRLDALFNEFYYIRKYSDVANAVRSGSFSSGLDHFLRFGLRENRSGGADFDEGFYLRKYPDVANAVRSGGFSSGLNHFARFGEAEGRSGTAFDEDTYRVTFPDVANAVAAGAFTSGAEHYLLFGQFEDSRIGIFTGTSGNDIVQGFGGGTALVGVDIQATGSTAGPRSFGVGEIDTLIGLGDGIEVFNLGVGSSADTGARQFYVGNGNSDYALIRYFDTDQDLIQMIGSSSEYTQAVVNGSLNISTSAGDLVAIVEGYTSTLSVVSSNNSGAFYFG